MKQHLILAVAVFGGVLLGVAVKGYMDARNATPPAA